MIDTLMNLLFRCSHKRLTRPVTPVSRGGIPHGDTYVVCLDCGKQFGYDLKTMQIGGPLKRSLEHGVLPPEAPAMQKSKLKYALWAIPLALVVGSSLKKK